MAWSVAYLMMSFDTPLPWVRKSFIGRPDDMEGVDHKSLSEEDKKLMQATSFFNKDFFSKEMLN